MRPLSRSYLYTLLLGLALLLVSLIPFAGCAAAKDPAAVDAELQKWQEVLDLYTARAQVLHQVVDSYPPGPKRDKVLKDIAAAEYHIKFARDMLSIVTGRPLPSTTRASLSTVHWEVATAAADTN